MKKLNFFMFSQWLIFAPIIIPISIITGAYEGLKKTFNQATSDILCNEEAN